MKKRANKPQQYCAGNFGGPCVLHDTPHEMCEFMGPRAPMSRAWATDLVKHGTMNATEAWRDALVDRMVNYGECLWHAAARLANKPCSCAACTNPKHPAHAWSIVDPVVDPA